MCEREQSSASPAISPTGEVELSSTELRYLVRQPIFDVHNRLHSYELLFQLQSNGPAGGRGAHAMRAILDDILLYGLDKLTKNLPVFLTCSAESLTEPFVTVLPPEQAILGVSEQLQFYPNMIKSCRKLKEMGYRLAVEDFSWGPLPHVLFSTVDFLKLNPEEFGDIELARLHKLIGENSITLIADKINTQDAYRRAREKGFIYFQGFYFCAPEFIQKNKVPSNKLFHVELLHQLRSDPLDLKKLAPLVKRDTSLVYRLLKLVNSPLCAIRQEIHSIESAILVLGEETFRRIAMLAILSELNAGQPAEILYMALIRARFCELAAAGCSLNSEEQYLLGMLSLLPAMLCRPMEDLTNELPLRPEIRKALLGDPILERSLLSWIEAHERNEISRAYAIADLFGLNVQKLEQFYVDAILWEAVVAKGT
jgi:c-di-GMP phosphodiesterase